MSDNKLALSQTYQEKMRDRIREAMGDLLTDKDIKIIIEKGVDDFLFKPRYRPRSNGYGNEELPPYISLWVEKFLSVRIMEAVQEWIKNNPEKFEESIKKVIQEGAGKAMMTAFLRITEEPLLNLQNEIMQRFSRE